MERYLDVYKPKYKTTEFSKGSFTVGRYSRHYITDCMRFLKSSDVPNEIYIYSRVKGSNPENFVYVRVALNELNQITRLCKDHKNFTFSRNFVPRRYLDEEISMQITDDEKVYSAEYELPNMEML